MKQVLVLAVFLCTTMAWAGLTYEGSSTIGENVMPEASTAFEAKEKIKFDSIGLKGSGEGIKAVMAGAANIGGLSRALKTEEKAAKPYYQNIGYDAIAVFVHASNPVKALTKDQIKKIFTGKIANWKDVGGKAGPITVVTELQTGDRATVKEFKEMAMDKEAYGPSRQVDKPHDCVGEAAKDSSVITYASSSFKSVGGKMIGVNGVDPTSDNVKSGEYLLSRPLVLVSKEAPTGDAKKFFDFILSPEGQAIVGKKFVPAK